MLMMVLMLDERSRTDAPNVANVSEIRGVDASCRSSHTAHPKSHSRTNPSHIDTDACHRWQVVERTSAGVSMRSVAYRCTGEIQESARWHKCRGRCGPEVQPGLRSLIERREWRRAGSRERIWRTRAIRGCTDGRGKSSRWYGTWWRSGLLLAESEQVVNSKWWMRFRPADTRSGCGRSGDWERSRNRDRWIGFAWTQQRHCAGKTSRRRLPALASRVSNR